MSSDINEFDFSFADSSQDRHQNGCFPATSTVQTSTGETRLLSELKVGEKVLSVNGAGELVYSEVFMFLDRDEEQSREFVKIETDGGASVTATPSHLIYVWRSAQETISDYKFAGLVQVDDFVLVNVNGTLQPQKVVAIKSELHRGVYAPLTYDGTIVVDAVSASCYALIDTQRLAHFSMAPMRMLHATEEWLTGNSIESDAPRGVHWYARTLNKLTSIFLPSKWFYQT